MREHGIMPDLFSNMSWSHGEICMLTIHVLGRAFMSCSSSKSKPDYQPLCHCHLVCLHCDSGTSIFLIHSYAATVFLVECYCFHHWHGHACIYHFKKWCHNPLYRTPHLFCLEGGLYWTFYSQYVHIWALCNNFKFGAPDLDFRCPCVPGAC